MCFWNCAGEEAGRTETDSQTESVVPVCVLVWYWELFVFAAGRTRTSRKLMSQQSAMCAQTQSLEPAETHGEYGVMKSTKVQNPRHILHILRSMPMRVHRACAGSVRNYTHAHYL